MIMDINDNESAPIIPLAFKGVSVIDFVLQLRKILSMLTIPKNPREHKGFMPQSMIESLISYTNLLDLFSDLSVKVYL